MDARRINDISREIVGAAIEVHRGLGPGLLESAYEQCLCHGLSIRSISFRRQVELPVIYKGVKLECGYRADLIVDECVIVEVKAVEKLLPIHDAQLMTYLKLLEFKLGLLINFHVPLVKDGIKRIVRGLEDG
ncbi:MAG: GxxExxY protein [Planctomycetota bacterium]|nr:MAG: GxxExxY protein [Planctomycetota bacterium]